MLTTNGKIWIAIIAATTISIGLGLALGLWLSSKLPNEAASAGDPSVPVNPHAERPHADAAFDRSPQGAVAAASNYVLIPARADLGNPSELRTALKDVAAPAWFQDAARQANRGYRFVRERYGDADVSGAVIRYQLRSFSPARAVVKVWTVTVATGSHRQVVEEAWGTSLIDLVWLDGQWRIQDVSNTSGPAPIDLPNRPEAQTAKDLMSETQELSFAPGH